MQEAQSIFQKEVQPFKQLIVAVALNIIALGIVKSSLNETTQSTDSVVYCEVSFSILLVFMLFNSVFSIPYKKRTQYFRDSIIAYVILGGVGGLLAAYLSGLSMDEAGSFRWLYFVFTFTYLVFISIVNLMRKIIEIAKRQDARLRGEEE